MGKFIIHKDGVYNVFSTIVDAPILAKGITLEELKEQVKEEYGLYGVACLNERLERVIKNGGCSAQNGMSLADCISGNRAGPNETELSFDDFVQKFLTL